MLLVHRPDFPVAAIHREGGHVAFYLTHRPVIGVDLLRSSDVCLPDGGRPQPGSVIQCATCGRPLLWSSQMLDFVDVTIERTEP